MNYNRKYTFSFEREYFSMAFLLTKFLLDYHLPNANIVFDFKIT